MKRRAFLPLALRVAKYLGARLGAEMREGEKGIRFAVGKGCMTRGGSRDATTCGRERDGSCDDARCGRKG